MLFKRSKLEIVAVLNKLEELGYLKNGKPTAQYFVVPEVSTKEKDKVIYNVRTWWRELVLELHKQSDPLDPLNYQRSFVLALNDEQYKDFRNFMRQKMKEFAMKFEAPPNTSDSLHYVYFGHQKLTK